MKRAENLISCKVNYIDFEDDCLVFRFAKSKGHRDGEDHVGPWNVSKTSPHNSLSYPRFRINGTIQTTHQK